MRGGSADVFHILDHSDAHLIRVLDPERTVITCHDIIPILATLGVIPVHVPASVAFTYKWRIAHLRRARAVIAVSHATRTTLERYAQLRREQITVIPQGVGPAFRPSAAPSGTTRATAGVSETAAVVLQVASAGKYKNTETVLKAFAQLRASLRERAVLVRIGAPLHREERELAEQLGIMPAVRLVGHVDDKALAAWYNAANVLVFPSWWEGFGWPPLEAMACGTPVVASDTPAVAEVVNDAGYLIPPDDVSAFAAAIEHVLTDRTRAESMKRKGLNRASQFTWARTAASTLAVYNSMIQ